MTTQQFGQRSQQIIMTGDYDSDNDWLIEWPDNIFTDSDDSSCDYHVDECCTHDDYKEYDDQWERELLEQLESDECAYVEDVAKTTGIDFNIILECCAYIKQARSTNLSEWDIYYAIKTEYGHHFYDVYFTLNSLLQIDYNSDDDVEDESMTSETTTEQSMITDDCVVSDHSSDMCD